MPRQNGRSISVVAPQCMHVAISFGLTPRRGGLSRIFAPKDSSSISLPLTVYETSGFVQAVFEHVTFTRSGGFMVAGAPVGGCELVEQRVSSNGGCPSMRGGR